MKFAVFADLHLPDREDTVKEQILDWALECARREHADFLVGAGDLTGFGTLPAAERLRAKLDRSGIPFLLTPGNAECRDPESAAAVAELLRTPECAAGFLMLDSACGRLTLRARELLRDVPPGSVAVTHTPPDAWPEEDRRLFDGARRDLSLLIAGHVHFDRSQGKIELVRGLDPDKAIGGAPAVTFFESAAGGGWKRSECVSPAADPHRWPEALREEFLGRLGISGMNAPLESLAFAAEERVPCFELRFESLSSCGDGALRGALDRWRGEGGNELSLHLPEAGFRDGAVFGGDRLRAALDAALSLGCCRGTMHVPRFTLGESRDPGIFSAVAAAVAAALDPALAAGMRIGVENLHMNINPGEKPDDSRGFGYTSAECAAWIAALRDRVGAPGRIGFHFDIGHARNNAPYSSTEPVASWLAALGNEIDGCHLHQVTVAPDGSFHNHTPLTGLYDRLISLASFLMEWRRIPALRRAPLFLEIRGGAESSLRGLRRAIRG